MMRMQTLAASRVFQRESLRCIDIRVSNLQCTTSSVGWGPSSHVDNVWESYQTFSSEEEDPLDCTRPFRNHIFGLRNGWSFIILGPGCTLSSPQDETGQKIISQWRLKQEEAPVVSTSAPGQANTSLADQVSMLLNFFLRCWWWGQIS